MKIYTYKELRLAPRGGVIALGFFDGVHAAHRELLKMAKEEAELRRASLGVFTFSSESNIKSDKKRLYTTDERLDLIAGLGGDFAVVADFSEICSIEAEDFVRTVLADGLGASVAVAGYNFRFGKGARGNSICLAKEMSRYGDYAIIFDKFELDGKEVSSSAVRALIEEGKIEDANRLLGSPYCFCGKVEHGNSMGKSLGFPTINTPLENGKIIPRLGVYRSAVLAGGNIYNSVTNVGKCPTLGEREIHLETHLIDFRGDLYGENVKIFLLGYLREERTFKNEKELIMQINVDKNNTIIENGEEKWQEHGLK